MRTHGTLTRWNDERGFGFVAPTHAGDEIFVHISAFPRDGVRPHVDELISFDIEVGKDGKKRAVRVLRPGSSRAPARRRSSSRGRPRFLATALGLLAVGLAGTYGYRMIVANRSPDRFAGPASPGPAPAELAADEPFRCDGRTRCSQMASCAEAEYFLRHCPAVQMDGDGDGVPCEDQWCH